MLSSKVFVVRAAIVCVCSLTTWFSFRRAQCVKGVITEKITEVALLCLVTLGREEKPL